MKNDGTARKRLDRFLSELGMTEQLGKDWNSFWKRRKDAKTLKNLESFLFKRNENTARKGWNLFYRMRNDGAT